MKQLYFFCLFLVLCVHNLSAQCVNCNVIQVSPGETVGGALCNDPTYDEHRRWETVFYDGFNGSSSVNSNIWMTNYPKSPPLDRIICQANGYEQQLYYPDCEGSPCDPLFDPFTFSSSTLKITAKYSQNAFTYSGISNHWSTACNLVDQQPFSITRNISSGVINTPSRDFKFGRLDIRFRVDKAREAWPAFWLIGSRYEIDIFEIFDTKKNSGKVDFAVHLYDSNGLSGSWKSKYQATKGFFTNRMNVISLIRTPSKIVWLVNGIERARINRYLLNGSPISCGTVNTSNTTWNVEENPFYSDVVMDIRANLAVQSTAPNMWLDYPCTFEIDYIRFTQKSGPCITSTISKISGQECSGESAVYSGEYIGGANYTWTVSGGATIVDQNYNNSVITVHFPSSGQYFLSQTSFNSCEGRYVTTNKIIFVSQNCFYYRSISQAPDEEISTVEDELEFTPTDIEVTLYPNPITEHRNLYIRTSNEDIGFLGIKLYDANGSSQPVTSDYSVRDRKHVKSIVLPSVLRPGVYFCEIMFENGNKVIKKIVVK